MTRAVLALGANLGDRFGSLQAALDELARQLPVLAVSSVYETVAVGGPVQPDFLNAVVIVGLPDDVDLLGVLRAVESAGGRSRGVRWGPRSIDVDVVSVADRRSADPALTLPHPRVAERAFVLVPWVEVDPAATLPGLGPVAGLAAARQSLGVRRRPDLVLRKPAAR